MWHHLASSIDLSSGMFDIWHHLEGLTSSGLLEIIWMDSLTSSDIIWTDWLLTDIQWKSTDILWLIKTVSNSLVRRLVRSVVLHMSPKSCNFVHHQMYNSSQQGKGETLPHPPHTWMESILMVWIYPNHNMVVEGVVLSMNLHSVRDNNLRSEAGAVLYSFIFSELYVTIYNHSIIRYLIFCTIIIRAFIWST